MLKSFLTGLGIGAGLGVLLAPTSGEELRRELQERAADVIGRLRSAAEPVVQSVAEELRDPAALVDKAKGAAGDALDRGREKLGEVIEMARQRFSSESDLLNSATREALLKIPGIGPVTADKLIEGRPYQSLADLTERKLVAPSILEALRTALLGDKRQSA